jgi:hypothetical protein
MKASYIAISQRWQALAKDVEMAEQLGDVEAVNAKSLGVTALDEDRLITANRGRGRKG